MTLGLFKKILNFYWQSDTEFGVHSPAIHDFVQEVFKSNKADSVFKEIELKRKELLQSKKSISFLELGAGSRSKNGSQRKIKDVAKYSLSGPRQCRILYQLIKKYKPQNIIEMGTSLGISTAYMGAAISPNPIISLEGNPSSITEAYKILNSLDIENVNILEGPFEYTLKEAKQKFKKIDLAFVDGNHRYQATMDYFNALIPKISRKSIFIFDDIYWSDEMNQAWEEIKSQPEVAYTIDVFNMGIVFFDKSIMPKQHFKLIDYKWKPWAIGIFK